MSQFATGFAPNQTSANELLGQAAFMDVADLHSLFTPATTLDRLRNARNYPAAAVLVTNTAQRGVFFQDAADASTPDDGQDCIVCADGMRYKRSLLMRRYTPTSSLDAALSIVGSCCYDTTRFYVRVDSSTIKFLTFSGTL